MKLRDYQTETVNDVYRFFSSGLSRCLIYLSTGAGKSAIFSELAKRAVLKQSKVLFIVRRRQLVIKTVEDFARQGFQAGYVMAGQHTDMGKLLTVCSIDTAMRRDFSGQKYDLAIVDEAHDAASGRYRAFIDSLSCRFFVGFTATPFRVGTRGHTFWDCISRQITMDGLVERGFLVDAKLFGPPMKAQLHDIKMSAGDYNQKDLSQEMSKLAVVGDVVENYKRLGENRPAICFCVTVEHSKRMAFSFNQAGIPAMHVDCDDGNGVRQAAIDLLKSGKIKVLCNVNIWSTGVDIPCAEVAILARPTTSVNLYLQQVGRVFRPFRVCGSCRKQYDNSENCYHCGHDKPAYVKQYAIIIDHGENIIRHGQPHLDRPAELTDKPRGKAMQVDFKLKSCESCYAVMKQSQVKCHECGHTPEDKSRDVNTVHGHLVEYQKVKPLSDGEIRSLFKQRFARI